MDRGIPYRATALAEIIWRVADAVGMDPTEIALKNCHTPEPSLRACIEAGKTAIGWQWHTAGAKKLANGKCMAMASDIIPIRTGEPLPMSACILKAMARFTCRIVKLYEVSLLLALVPWLLPRKWAPVRRMLSSGRDMMSLPFNLYTYGGNTASFTWVAKEAAIDLRGKLLNAAAAKLKVAPDELDIKDSTVYLKSDPTKSYGFGTFAPLEVSFRGAPSPASDSTYNTISSVNTIFCEVEVDTETGEVEITNMIGVHDCGKIIRPSSYYGQLEGNMIWNIGFGKTEEYIYDQETGVLLNGNALEYKIPTMLDSIPAAKGVGVETRGGGGAYGASAGVAHQIICRNIVRLAVYQCYR